MNQKSPMECKTLDEVCSLRTDNFGTDTHWILTDSFKVTICAQKPGSPSTESISVDRKTFNRLIRWYTRQQSLRSKP